MRKLKLLLIVFTTMLLTSCMVTQPATAQENYQSNYQFEYDYDYDEIDYLYTNYTDYFYTRMYVNYYGVSLYWYQHPHFNRYRSQYYRNHHRRILRYTHLTYKPRNRYSQSRTIRNRTHRRSDIAERSRNIRVKPRTLRSSVRMNKYPIRNYTKPRTTQRNRSVQSRTRTPIRSRVGTSRTRTPVRSVSRPSRGGGHKRVSTSSKSRSRTNRR